MRHLFLWVALFASILSIPARAVQPDEVMTDPVLEARARSLSSELRCLVCQNQSIDDSAAPLARDLRLIVRERLKAGDSDTDVKHYLVSRFGDFVLLKPPFKAETLLLWLAPPGLLLIGAAALWGRRRPAAAASEPPLSEAERARLEALTGESA